MFSILWQIFTHYPLLLLSCFASSFCTANAVQNLLISNPGSRDSHLSCRGRRYRYCQIRVKFRPVRILKSDASSQVNSFRFSGNTSIRIVVTMMRRDKAIYLPSIAVTSIFLNNALITIRCGAWKERGRDRR